MPVAALAASATGHVAVTILPTPAGLDGAAATFAAASIGSGSGRMVLNPMGGTGGMGAASGTDLPAAGRVVLIGPPGMAATISLSSGDVARGPGAAMPFRVVAASALSALDHVGTLQVALSATLAVGRGQTPGPYRGTYSVTVDY